MSDTELRRRAEERALENAAEGAADVALSPEAIRRALHELRVHQIELEMQNEELRRAQAELEASEARFFDLYDLAPVGYLTLSEAGLVLTANLTVASLLGVARGALVAQPLSRFVASEDQDAYYLHRRRLVTTDAPQACELRLRRAGGDTFWARVEATAGTDSDGAPLHRVIVSDVSERRRAEDSLRESERKYRTLVETTGTGFLIFDGQGRVVDANPEYVRLSGHRDLAEVLGRSVMEWTAPQARERSAAAVAACLREGRIRDLVIDYFGPDGRLTPVEINATIEGDGDALRIVSLCRDVTERRRAEERLRESEEKYRSVVEHAREAIFIAQDGRLVFSNPATAAILGVPAAEIAAHRYVDFIHPDDRALVADRHARRLRGEALQGRYAFRLVSPAGQLRWAELSAVAVTWAGRPATLIFLTDVTERRGMVEALRTSEEWHRALFERSRDALMTLAPPAWRYTTGNAAALALFGARDDADFTARTPWELSPERQPDGQPSVDRARAMIDRALRDGAHEFEWTHRRLSGEEFPASVLLARVEVAGQPLLQATVRDVTEERRLQASLAQADRLASMGMLAAGVAHEINNPLAYVLFNVESLAEDLPKLARVAGRCRTALRDRVGEDDLAALLGDDAALLQPDALADAADRAREAFDGAHRIKGVTRGLGTFSHVDAADRARVDLNEAIESAVKMTRNEIRFRARLEKELQPLPTILATEGKLSQLFLNLLINAAHAIDEGDVDGQRVSVRTWAAGDDVFAEVGDTGRGIAAADRERIFEPFVSSRAAGKGAGLGLAICRSIVAELGGDIQVDSEVGMGARFRVRLPVRPDPSEARPAAGRPTPATPAVRGRVLLIDDEEPIRRVIGRQLSRFHDVLTAASGREGHPREGHRLRRHPVRPDDAGDDRHGPARLAGGARPGARRPGGLHHRRRLHPASGGVPGSGRQPEAREAVRRAQLQEAGGHAGRGSAEPAGRVMGGWADDGPTG